jgi:hypothetical protein
MINKKHKLIDKILLESEEFNNNFFKPKLFGERLKEIQDRKRKEKEFHKALRIVTKGLKKISEISVLLKNEEINLSAKEREFIAKFSNSKIGKTLKSETFGFCLVIRKEEDENKIAEYDIWFNTPIPEFRILGPFYLLDSKDIESFCKKYFKFSSFKIIYLNEQDL